MKRNSLIYALTSDVRVEILKYLGGQRPGEKVGAQELSEVLGRRFEFISYHLQRLHEFGAVRLITTRPARGPIRLFYVFSIDDPFALKMLGLNDTGAADSDETAETSSP
jgi:hypothetical protein